MLGYYIKPGRTAFTNGESHRVSLTKVCTRITAGCFDDYIGHVWRVYTDYNVLSLPSVQDRNNQRSSLKKIWY